MSESRRPGRRRRRRSCDGTGLGRGPVTGVRAGSREEERERESFIRNNLHNGVVEEGLVISC